MTTDSHLTPDQQAILVARVERLWRKARSTEYPAEREAFESKALYLMARARITEAMLDLDAGGPADSIVDVKIGEELRGGYRVPAETIFNTVCHAFGCRAYLYVRGRRSQPAAVGFASDIDRVRLLWPLLLTDALRAATTLRGPTAATTTGLRRSAMYGYAEAISDRFAAINRLATDDADRGVDHSSAIDDAPVPPAPPMAGGTGRSALVVRDRRERVDEVFDGLGISRRSRRASAGHGGFEYGRAAGMAADLTGGRHTVPGGGRALPR